MAPTGQYPATLEIDYPDRDLSRLTTFFRPLTAIPILIVLAFLTGPGSAATSNSLMQMPRSAPEAQVRSVAWKHESALVLRRQGGTSLSLKTRSRKQPLQGGGILFGATVLMLVFRHKYPRWWFDWNLALTRFSTRVCGYLFLLDDTYPSTDEDQAVHIAIPYPDAPRELNRWLPLVKWLLALPHYIVLVILTFGMVVCVVLAWFAILITARYPRALFNYVVGVLRWWLRVSAYAFLLTTDSYPPFSMAA